MKNRIFSILLTIVMLISIMPGFTLTASAESTFDKAADGYYEIASANDWYNFAQAAKTESSANARLTSDIDFTGVTDLSGYVINSYSGIFDGKDFTVKNIEATVTNSFSFFTTIQANGNVKNFKLDNISVLSTTNYKTIALISNKNNGTIENIDVSGITLSSNYYTSVFAYQNYGTIRGCEISNLDLDALYTSGAIACQNYSGGTIEECKLLSGSVTVYNSSTSSDIGGGGIVGKLNGGTIKDCTNAATVSVTGGRYNNAGGIAGSVEGSSSESAYFLRCSNTGNITLNDTSSNGPGYAGGITGGHSGSSSSSYFNVEECYNTGNIRAEGNDNIYASGIAGKSGYNGSYIKNCWNSGTVTNTSPDTSRAASGIAYTGNAYLYNCLNVGTIIAGARACPIIGTSSGSQAYDRMPNCYSIKNCLKGIDDTTVLYGSSYYGNNEYDKEDGVTETELANGSVLEWLNSGNDIDVWGQIIGTHNHPVLISNDPSIESYIISTTLSTAEGGSVAGGGAYEENASVTLTATANEGYMFAGWMENGALIPDAAATYTFNATADRTLIAVFSPVHTITVNLDGGVLTQAAKDKMAVYGITETSGVLSGKLPEGLEVELKISSYETYISKAGYTLVGFTDGITTYNSDTTITVSESKTYSLIWEEKLIFHTHCICGDDACADAGHTDVTYTALDVASLTTNAYDEYYYLPDGNYYLEENLTVNKALRISGNVNICLNGKTLTRDTTVNYWENFKVDGGSLTICDCEGGGKVVNTINGSNIDTDSASITIYDGIFEAAGRALDISGTSSSAETKIYGGTITSTGDDAINVTGTNNITVYGGRIESTNTPTYRASNAIDAVLNNGYTVKILGGTLIGTWDGVYSDGGVVLGGLPVINGTEADINLVYSGNISTEGTLSGTDTYSVVKLYDGLFFENGAAYIDRFTSADEEYVVEVVGNDLHLVAKPYTVTFNANGGEGTMANQIIGAGTATALSPNAFTREYYSFAGWARSASGAVVYDDGESVTDIANPGESITLYAKWEAIYKDYVINTNTLSEVQSILAGIAEVTEVGEQIKIKLTSDVLGRIKFEAPATNFVLDLNGKTITPGNKAEALCLENGYSGTVTVTGSGTFKAGVNNVIYKSYTATLKFALADGCDYFTFKDGTTNILSDEINNTTTELRGTYNHGTSYVLMQVVCAHPYTYSASGSVITETCICGHSATATVKAPTGTFTYDGTAKEATVEYSSGWQGGTLTVSYGTNGNINAGTVTASITKGNATAAASYAINKIDPVVTAPTARENLVFSRSSQALVNAGTTTGGEMQYKINDSEWSNRIPRAANAGSYTVYYKVAGDTNYNENAGGSVVVTIARADVLVTAPTAKTGLIYNGNAQELINAGSSTGGVLQYKLDNTPWSIDIPTATDAGSHTVYYKFGGSVNYNPSAGGSIVVTIAKIDPVVTAPTAKTGLRYNGNAHELINAGSTTGGELLYSLDNMSWAREIPTATNADNYTVYYKVVEDINYNRNAGGSIAVNIAKADPTYTVPTAKTGLVYTGSAQELINPGTVNGGTMKYAIGGAQATTAIPTGTGVGEYRITCIIEGDANHNNAAVVLSSAPIVVNIAKADPAVSAPTEKSGLVYNGADQALVNAGSTIGGEMLYSLDETSWNSAIPTGKNADDYTVYYKVVGNDNYNGNAGGNISVSIAKLPVTVSWSNTSFVYDGTEKTVTASVTNAVGSDVVNLTVAGNERTNAGSYTAEITAVDNDNYALSAATTHNWSILKSETGLSYGLENGRTPSSSFIYGDTITVTVAAQPTGTAATGMGMMAVPAADQMALFLGTQQITEPADPVGGEYTFNIDTTATPLGYGNITLTGQYVGTDNMASASIDIPLTLEKAPSSVGTLPAEIGGLVYNLNEHTLITAGSGVVGGSLMYKLDSGSYSTELPKATDAGIYTVYYKVFGDANHLDTAESSFNVIISPKPLDETNVEPIAMHAYTGSAIEPTVTVTDGANTLVRDTDYTVAYSNNTAIGEATVTVTYTGNYTGVANITFHIARRAATPAIKYEIRFNTNGGSAVKTQKVEINETAVKPENPTKAGYVFAGWYTDAELENEYRFDEKVRKTITLYAKWEELITPGGELPFEDVSENDWFYEYVKYVKENGLMLGVTDTTFDPDGGITRAMMVTVLHRAENEPDVDFEATFDDVEAGSYYEKAVAWGQKNGIINGYSETEFAPDEIIIREQVAAIMYRYANYKGIDTSVGENTNILSYDDYEEISEYAISAIQYACGSGFMKGNTESTWNPQLAATRAQIAAIITRVLESK